MATAAFVDEEAILSAIKAVRSDESPENFLVIGYEDPKTMKLEAVGVEGLAGAKEFFKEGGESMSGLAMACDAHFAMFLVSATCSIIPFNVVDVTYLNAGILSSDNAFRLWNQSKRKEFDG